MKTIAIAGLGLLAAPCAAQWWWPPTDGLTVSPECLSPATQVSLTVSGQWPDACVPNFISALVNGADVDLTTVRDPPPAACLTVISNWSKTAVVGPLAVGSYSVWVTHRVAGQVVHQRTQIGTISVVASCGGVCYPNCDGSTSTPLLTANDFTCFVNAYAAQQSYANCDGSTGSPALTGNDFVCFINAYATGCT